MKKTFIIMLSAVAFLPLLTSNAFAPIDKLVLQNKVQYNKMLTTYPELRDYNIKFIPQFSEKLEICEDNSCYFAPAVYENETISIRKNVNPFSLQHFLFHEVGHLIYRTKLNNAERKSWERLFNESPVFVSEYSKESSSENFAELYASLKYGTGWEQTYSGLEMLSDSVQAKIMKQVYPKYRFGIKTP